MIKTDSVEEETPKKVDTRFGYYEGEKELQEKINGYIANLEEKIKNKELKPEDINFYDGAESIILEFFNLTKDSMREIIFEAVKKDLDKTPIPCLAPKGDWSQLIDNQEEINKYILDNFLKPEMWHLTEFNDTHLNSGREIFKFVYNVSEEGNSIQAKVIIGRPTKQLLKSFITFNLID